MELKQIESAYRSREARLQQLKASGTNCFQLFSGSLEGIPELLIEYWNGLLILNVYDPLLFENESFLEQIAQFFEKELKLTGAIARYFVPDRSREAFEKDKHIKKLLGELPSGPFTISENNCQFLVRLDKGFSLGLFLDQRENRKALAELEIPNSKVLNLFSYTCGFSLYQAKTGRSTTSVDISGPALQWGKDNFTLNGIHLESHYFYKQDSLLFLKRALKRKETFGLVVIDPPSFSRSKEGGVFQIEKDLSTLLLAAFEVVEPKGYLFFSSNFQGWKNEKPSARIESLLPGCRYAKAQDFSRAFDFEKTEVPIDYFLIQKLN